MLAVLNIVKNETIPTITKLFHKACNSIKNQLTQFKQFGISSLYGKPRSGRPSKLADHKITGFFVDVKDGIFPKQIVHQIKKDTGIKYAESGIRDILRRHNFAPKAPDSAHKNKVSNKKQKNGQRN